MPSSQLALICEQIEKQPTDHFGKFYMYVGLLNTLTVKNKPFADSLPKYSGLFSTKHLNIGEIPVGFSQQLHVFAHGFQNLEPHWSKTLKHIFLNYIRQGKITDLTYIIDQMLYHLLSIHGQPSHNQSIYNDINFDQHKIYVVNYIKNLSDFNHQLLSLSDSICNIALSAITAATGLVLVVSSIFSLVPPIIGLSLCTGGVYAGLYFLNQVKPQIDHLEEQLTTLKGAVNNNISIVCDSYNNDAFYGAIFKLLNYTVVTVEELLVLDESQKTLVTTEREELDACFNRMGL